MPMRSFAWSDLALQVGEIDDVVVDDADRADAGGGQVERGRRAEAAGTEQEHLGVEQLQLALEPDLRDEHVARVALALLGRERARDLDLIAAVLPERDAPAHGRDVLVAEQVLHRLRGEGGAVARGAVQDHALVALADRALDTRLEVRTRHVHGAGQVRLLELVLLAHVDDHGTVAVGCPLGARAPRPPRRMAGRDQVVDLLRVHLLDLLLHLAEQLSATCHRPIPLNLGQLSILQKV